MANPKPKPNLSRIYRRSFENMRDWLERSPLRFDEKLGIIDAWQEDLRALYREHGQCYACDRPMDTCICAEPLDRTVH